MGGKLGADVPLADVRRGNRSKKIRKRTYRTHQRINNATRPVPGTRSFPPTILHFHLRVRTNLWRMAARTATAAATPAPRPVGGARRDAAASPPVSCTIARRAVPGNAGTVESAYPKSTTRATGTRCPRDPVSPPIAASTNPITTIAMKISRDSKLPAQATVVVAAVAKAQPRTMRPLPGSKFDRNSCGHTSRVIACVAI